MPRLLCRYSAWFLRGASARPSGGGRQARPRRSSGPSDGAPRLVALLLVALPALRAAAAAEPAVPSAPVRRPDATAAEMFGGPFPSSRLFAMPIADVVGPYQLSLSGEGSLLSDTGALSLSTVVAIGFGDIAQLEYRGTSAVTSLDRTPFQLPTLGVQLKIPLPERKYVPAFAVAYRRGFTRQEAPPDGAARFDERVDDFYVVGRWRLWGALRWLTLHGGLRISPATLSSDDPALARTARTLLLPAVGWEIRANPRARVLGELALVPAFEPGSSAAARPNRIADKPFGRLGVRWSVFPAFVLDASIGYRIEVARLQALEPDSLSSFVDWDLRLGGELFLPWGAVACRALKVLCE